MFDKIYLALAFLAWLGVLQEAMDRDELSWMDFVVAPVVCLFWPVALFLLLARAWFALLTWERGK